MEITSGGKLDFKTACISSIITVAVISSMFSNSDSVIRDPKVGLKNFSPGRVMTIFLTERAIALRVHVDVD